MEPMDLIVSDIKRLMMSVEIFQKGLSDVYESIDAKIDYARYKRAYMKQDTFDTYKTYDPELLLAWGITNNETFAIQWGNNPSLIPKSMRQLVLINQRNHVIRTYVEPNEYIRVRNGLPTIKEMEDRDFVFASDQFYEKYEMGQKPLHLFTEIDHVRLRNSGEYQEILEKYPDKKYLRYIGMNKIDLFVMKEAKNYDLLFYDKTLDRRLLNDFTKLYEQNRMYLVNVLYVKDFSTRYPYYDPYMAFLLLTMTIQRLIANVFQNGIDRDYYDLFNLQMLFESYNIPFLKNLPMDYQRLLARNLNRLLRYKSSDRVLYDVAELLGFNESQFFKYYLVKQRRMDVDGLPITATKKVVDELGEEHEVPDYEKMYELYFQGVSFDEEDVGSALEDITNRIAYEDMVIDDDFWWDDDADLRKALYETEYNIIESKYIGVHSMYRITEMVHEVANFFRLIIDNKALTENIFIALPKIKSDGKITFFEAIVFGICLICKRNKSRGEIITTPSKTLHVIGFNFRADFNLIRQHLQENSHLMESDKISRLIMDLEMTTVDDINRVYGNIKELWNFLVDKIAHATSIEVYEAYDKLYKALIYTDDMHEIFTKKDGTVAETYFEYLQDLNIELATLIEMADDTTILNYLEHLVYSLEDDLDNLEYMDYLIDSNGIMENALRKLIMFFKSYTIDLHHMSIIYIFDNKYYNMIKLIWQIHKMDSDITVATHMKRLMDEIFIHGEILHKEHLDLIFKHDVTVTLLLETLLKMKDKITADVSTILGDRLDMDDNIALEGEIANADRLALRDAITTGMELVIREFDQMRDKATITGVMKVASILTHLENIFSLSEITVRDRLHLINQTFANWIESSIELDDSAVTSDILRFVEANQQLSTMATFTTSTSIQQENLTKDNVRLIDHVDQLGTSIVPKDHMRTTDTVKHIGTSQLLSSSGTVTTTASIQQESVNKDSMRLKESILINREE